MWTRVNIADTPDSVRLEFGPGVGRHFLAFLVMFGAALSVYAILNQGDVTPASLILSGVVILLGALLRMGLRARSSAVLSESGLTVETRGVPPRTVALNHVESFAVEPNEMRTGIPGHHLRVHTRSSQDDAIALGRGLSETSLTTLAEKLAERLETLRG